MNQLSIVFKHGIYIAFFSDRSKAIQEITPFPLVSTFQIDHCINQLSILIMGFHRQMYQNIATFLLLSSSQSLNECFAADLVPRKLSYGSHSKNDVLSFCWLTWAFIMSELEASFSFILYSSNLMANFISASCQPKEISISFNNPRYVLEIDFLMLFHVI